MRADVVVVGGGLSGLAVAAQLTEAGLEVLLAEADERLGGRVRERRIDGFRVGGGHLAHTTWPALGALAEPGPTRAARLQLRSFSPGIRVYADGAALRFGVAPPRSPATRADQGPSTRADSAQQSMATLLAPIGSVTDRARLSTEFYRLARGSIDASLTGREDASGESFTSRGYSPVLVDGFLRRYLTALIADEDLAASVRGADWLLRMLVSGRFAVPEGGFEALVRLLADRLGPERILLGTRAHEVHADRVSTDAGLIHTSAVVVASDPLGAVSLFPGLHEPRMRPLTTLWHTVDADALPPGPDRVPTVLIDGDPASPVARTCVVSRVDPQHAPEGRELISTVVAGHDGKQLDVLDRAVMTRLERLHGVSAQALSTVEVCHSERALAAMDAPYNFTRPVRLIGGLYVCGDHRGLPNIEGALASASRAADAVLADLRRRSGH
jgi:phytoene dehydrogenase-like protein